MTRTRLLQRGDVLLLRAAVLPLDAQQAPWPSVDDPAACRRWLRGVWAIPAFADAVRAASPQLVQAVESILGDDAVSLKRVRKATAATARYLLRASGRPTPFGLFAGVATARCGTASARFGTAHRPLARPDTLWLSHVRRDLERRRDVLPHLTLQVSDLVVRRGETLVRPLSRGRTSSVRLSLPLAAVLEVAASPVGYPEVMEHLAALGGTVQQAEHLLSGALEAGILHSGLSAPMTEHDPLGHLLRTMQPASSSLSCETSTVLDALAEVHELLADHNTALDPAVAQSHRQAAEERMRQVSAQGRSRLSIDLRLDASVQVPERVLTEAEFAADALLRLTRNVGERPVWAAYHSLFWERYGAGSLVPVRDAVDLAAGVGLPADFPASLWAEPPVKALPRDELLRAMAWQAVAGGTNEIRLAEADLDRLSNGSGSDSAAHAPHTEMGIRLYAATQQDIEQGDFTLSVRPSWSTGTLTGRFAAVLQDSGLAESYAKLPTLVDGALTAQLSFAPVYPHGENVARTPAILPYVIPLDEHREPSEHLIPLDDLAVYSTSRRMHLVSLSRRRVVEPVVLHPLALEKQAPPIARFLALLSRGFATAWTQFDWGPLAAGLPCLPRVRYRKAILSPARWHLTSADLPSGALSPAWTETLTAWRASWKCPPVVELRDDDRTLRLDLEEPLHLRLLHAHLQRHGHADLLEAPDPAALGWIGHAHEITLPLTSVAPPLPHPDLARAPVVTNRMLPHPGDARQQWVQAKVFTHPTAMDQILTRSLPALLAPLGSPGCWFVRYRTSQEEDHLRIRVAAHGPDGHAATLRAFADWAADLQSEALAARLVFDGYRPEFGRYGTGPALAAAEEVFVADSTVVRYMLADLVRPDLWLLCALEIREIACGLLGDDAGTRWMATTVPARSGNLPDVTRRVLQHLRTGEPGPPTGWSDRLTEAYSQRRAALAVYRQHLADHQVGPVLESLLHMHHNRLLGPDRDAEAACRHAARQACRSLHALAVPGE